MLAWLSVWGEVQTCICSSWCHCHLLSLASVKSRLVLPFWYRLTWVVPEKWLLNGCVCVCVCIAIITTANLAVGPQIFRFLATKKFTALIIAILLLLSQKADTYFTVPWRVEGWVDLGTAVKVCSRCPTLYIATAVMINTTLSEVRVWVPSHCSRMR